MAVIVFSMAACDTPTSNSGGGSDSGGNFNYTGPVDNTVGATETNFSYVYDSAAPLSTSINSPASVTISGGNVTISLGTPKNLIINPPPPGLTMISSDAKVFTLSYFCTSGGNYVLVCAKDAANGAFLLYADKDFTITGTDTSGGGGTVTYNASLKKGWNYYIFSIGGSTTTVTSSTTLPSGFKWTVLANP
jgi:hypothetical protein